MFLKQSDQTTLCTIIAVSTGMHGMYSIGMCSSRELILTWLQLANTHLNAHMHAYRQIHIDSIRKGLNGLTEASNY